jgi:hypothetical protein
MNYKTAQISRLKPMGIIRPNGRDYSFKLFSDPPFIWLQMFNHGKRTGSIKIQPLYSRSKPKEKHAVLFSEITCSNLIARKTLIKEALMVSWEMDYKVAFVLFDIEIYCQAGFRRSENFGIISNGTFSAYFFDLAREGIKKIPADIEFPLCIEP